MAADRDGRHAKHHGEVGKDDPSPAVTQAHCAMLHPKLLLCHGVLPECGAIEELSRPGFASLQPNL